MARVGVVGASGRTGRLLVRELVRLGHEVIAVGGSRERLDAALEDSDRVEVRPLEPSDVALDGALGDVDAVLSTTGPFTGLGEAVLEVALELGVPYVDAAGEQAFVGRVLDRYDVPAREAGVSAVPAAGLPGDLLAAVAARRCASPRAVHIAYVVPGPPGPLASASPSARLAVVRALGRPGLAVVGGRPVREWPGEARRLAWFPQPLGPRHAAGVPGTEALTVPRHLPAVDTVRTYLAMSTWRAELTQLLATASRARGVRAALSSLLLDRARSRASGPVRWGCVVEILDAAPTRVRRPTEAGERSVVRAWAFGHDLHTASAVTMGALAEILLGGGSPPGVRSPAQAGDPADLLDSVAARSDLRWSVTGGHAR